MRGVAAALSAVRSRAAAGAALLAGLLLIGGALPAAADDERPSTRERVRVADPYQDGVYADTADQGAVAPDSSRALPEGAQHEPRPLKLLADVEERPPGEANRSYPFCTRKPGPYQRQVERYLGLKPDGRQSAADCKAIQRYQRAHKIAALGYAGPVTHGTLQLAAAAADPNARGLCPTTGGRVVCVDLTRQLLWTQDGRRILFKPVPIRSGRPGHETRTGTHRITWRNKNHWSSTYDMPMPYAQFFAGGQALHGTYGGVYRAQGSYGCVNLRFTESKALWNALRTGDRVHVFGKRPVR
ncbi:L,D-transpeptidase [Streptomyces polyrhachis]|uniref:L,D-transpeptidase n=1 Tax=Streptomyces polyrhachis TaxID=1282885 RepID=A0ABW2GDB5_9ACTN